MNKYIILIDSDNDREGKVLRSVYVTAKTKQLVEFGYSTLTEEETDRQITKVFKKQKLTIIGMFIKDEIKEIK